MLALAFMIFFAENIIHVFKLFLVVFFITSTLQIILDDTYSRPFFIDAPHLLGSSTSKISIHTSNIYFLAVCYRHLFFVCVETWLMQESEKRASTDVFVCITSKMPVLRYGIKKDKNLMMDIPSMNL